MYTHVITHKKQLLNNKSRDVYSHSHIHTHKAHNIAQSISLWVILDENYSTQENINMKRSWQTHTTWEEKHLAEKRRRA